MTRIGRVWFFFSVCALGLVGAMGWTTVQTLRLEQQEAEAWARVGREGAIRVALGRLDAAMGSLIAPEEARPYLHYRPTYRVTVMRKSKGSSAKEDALLLPSPLSEGTPRFVRLYFELGPDGSLTSPRSPKDGADAAAMLGMLGPLTTELAEISLPDRWAQAVVPQTRVPDAGRRAQAQEYQQLMQEQTEWTNSEYLARNATQNRVQGLLNLDNNLTQQRTPELSVEQGPLKPAWLRVDGERHLFFLRRVTVEGQRRIQGIWYDWLALRSWMLEQVEDLFPGADLVALADSEDVARTADEAGRRLATLPVSLEPGASPVTGTPGWSPTRTGLVLTWIAVVVALGSVGFMLRASIEFGERRSRFVSAVTHELRTPLTTFQMYAQMLASGMVSSEEARQEYLETLERESSRLSSVLDSVLIYSRLEQGRGSGIRERVRASELVDAMLPVLSHRVAEAGMELAPDLKVDDGAELMADPPAIERVVRNLVDNSSKYASGAADKSIRLVARVEGRCLLIDVGDGGPGVARDVRRRLFEPYRRASEHESGSIPGVGLGLALAQGLAKAHGGELTCVDPEGPGAVFRLSLPLA